MSKRLIFYSLTLVIQSVLIFQTMSAQTLNGEYNLHKHEMASGFRFTKDGKFEFYFVYGAVDRSATGTYTVEGDTLKLMSDKEPGKDFPVTKESHKGKGYTIQMTAPNEYLLRNIICFYFVGEVQNVVESDDKGVIHIDAPKVDKMYLQHQLFLDVASLIKDEKNTNNYFEVSLSPSLQFVSFKGIDFIIDGDDLTCLPNYFMPYDNIRYTKE